MRHSKWLLQQRRLEITLQVGNLSADTPREELREAFSVHGEVSAARVLTEERRFGSMVGPSEGYGFAVMPDNVRARAAVAALDRYELRGNAWMVQRARPRRVFGRRLP
jgi:hypothetical protein